MSIYEALVIRRDSKKMIQKYLEWSMGWWKWLLSIPISNNPAYDPIGYKTGINQNNSEVFYLCQTIESSKPFPKRSITVPRDKFIFLPIINWLSYQEQGQSLSSLKSVANERMDEIGFLQLSLNNSILNIDFQDFRVQTPFFEIDLPNENILNIKSGKTKMISDGYWVCLKPLRNDLDMESFGSCSNGITEIGVNYALKLDN